MGVTDEEFDRAKHQMGLIREQLLAVIGGYGTGEVVCVMGQICAILLAKQSDKAVRQWLDTMEQAVAIVRAETEREANAPN